MAENVAELRNIGPTIARRLQTIGVRTRAELEEVGAVGAYLRICASRPNQTIPVCYYLYSLQGALLDVHWDDLPERLKRRLLAQAADKVPKRSRARS